MSVWITPKTNLVSTDLFNVSDWDRIRGNMEHLQHIAGNYYASFEIAKTQEKTVSSWLYASDLNTIEQNLTKINMNTENLNIGQSQSFVPGGHSIDWKELNRIEQACLSLYRKFQINANRVLFSGTELYGGDAVGLI